MNCEMSKSQLEKYIIKPLESLKKLDENIRRSFLSELVKTLVLTAFRNGPIENLHAGFSAGEAKSLEEISKITDAEMKHLMQTTTNRLAELMENILLDPECLYALLPKHARDVALSEIASKEMKLKTVELIFKTEIRLTPSYWNDPDWRQIDEGRKKGAVRRQELMAFFEEAAETYYSDR